MSERTLNMTPTSQPHGALAVSAVTTTVSVASWAVDHSAWFTVLAAIAAIISGIAATFSYCVSIYFRIKNGKGE